MVEARSLSHPDLESPDIGPCPQLVGRIGCSKLMEKRARAVGPRAAVDVLFAATHTAIQPRSPCNALQAFEEVVADATGLAGKHPGTIRIGRGSYGA
jgi:hypothetical protein